MMTPHDFARHMHALEGPGDPESTHSAADRLMVALVLELALRVTTVDEREAIGRGLDSYDRVAKWYA